MKTGKCIIFSAPSGAGKTTIVNSILKQYTNFEFSVSATSRAPREGEINWTNYVFLSVDEFKEKIKNDEFVEWEEVYANQFYGTLYSEIERIWKKNNHVIFDVDVKGGVNLKSKFGNQALAIFIMPPSIDELEKRLRNRSTETEESLKKRVSKASEELTFAPKFDCIIINDDLQSAINNVLKEINKFLES